MPAASINRWRGANRIVAVAKRRQDQHRIDPHHRPGTGCQAGRTGPPQPPIAGRRQAPERGPKRRRHAQRRQRVRPDADGELQPEGSEDQQQGRAQGDIGPAKGRPRQRKGDEQCRGGRNGIDQDQRAHAEIRHQGRGQESRAGRVLRRQPVRASGHETQAQRIDPPLLPPVGDDQRPAFSERMRGGVIDRLVDHLQRNRPHRRQPKQANRQNDKDRRSAPQGDRVHSGGRRLISASSSRARISASSILFAATRSASTPPTNRTNPAAIRAAPMTSDWMLPSPCPWA